MKRRNFILSVASFMMLFFMLSCQKDFDDYNNVNPVNVQSSRLKVVNQNIPLVNNFGLKTEHTNPEFLFTLVAEVDAPSIASQTLQATHVDVHNNVAYVSYNMRGTQHLGAIDIIDIANPSNPQLLNTILFDNKDVNTVKVINGNIYFGGQDINGGYVAKSSLDNQDSDEIEIFGFSWGEGLNPFSVNSMDVSDADGDNQEFSYIWFTGGDNGGLYIIDPDDDGDGVPTTIETISDARSVKVLSNNEVYVLSGNDIHLWNGEFLSELGLLQPNWIQESSKSDIDVNDKYLFAATNRGGGLIIDIEITPTITQTIERPLTPNGMNPEDFVTNSVSVNNELLFWAQGGAGIIVCKTTPFDDDKSNLPFQELGYFDFGGPLSSNYVMSQDNYIFVATGLGGLKILTFEESGLPDDFQPGEVCETLQESIINMFPEQQNAIELHPYLFDGNNELRVITDSETEVWIQFIWEGAGWTNTFGYYTYELGNEPTSVSDLNKTVLFPNVSIVNGGGGLNPGDMVFIGEFPANTVIGFYLVAQGWQNGEMTNGIYTHYTDINLNPNNTQQHLLFMEDCCNELVLTFEDIRLPGGDKDFNDIMLTIKDNNNGFENLPGSFKTENVFFVPLCGGDFNPNDPCDNYQEETAYVGSDAGSNDGNPWWYYFDNTVKASHPIYAGQTLVEGAYAIYMDGVLTIELGDKMILQEGNETVKIQGYNEGDLPSFRPPAGLFTTYKGNELVIDLPYYPYYVIHLDVEVCWE